MRFEWEDKHVSFGSSVIRGVYFGDLCVEAHERQEGTLIEFTSGAKFFYKTTRETYEDFRDAASLGAFYNQRLKGTRGLHFDADGTVEAKPQQLFAVRLIPTQQEFTANLPAVDIEDAIERARNTYPGYRVAGVAEVPS